MLISGVHGDHQHPISSHYKDPILFFPSLQISDLLRSYGTELSTFPQKEDSLHMLNQMFSKELTDEIKH